MIPLFDACNEFPDQKKHGPKKTSDKPDTMPKASLLQYDLQQALVVSQTPQ